MGLKKKSMYNNPSRIVEKINNKNEKKEDRNLLTVSNENFHRIHSKSTNFNVDSILCVNGSDSPKSSDY